MSIPEPIETFMLRLGFDYSMLRQPSSPAAEQEEGRGQSGWVETIVHMSEHTPILAVVPVNCRVDPERLRQLAEVSTLRPATGEEVARLHPESEPGAVPPLGPLYGEQVFVDETVTRQDHIVFRAGTWSDAIRMRYADFAALVHPTVGRFAAAG